MHSRGRLLRDRRILEPAKNARVQEQTMYFIEDLAEDVNQPEPEKSDSKVSRYNLNQYERNSAADTKGTPANLPRKYGPGMELHKRDDDYKDEEKPDKDGKKVEYTKLQERIQKYKVGVAG